MIKKIVMVAVLMVGAGMAQTGGIRGQVTDSTTGTALELASVVVYSLSDHHPRPVAEVVTGEDGSYEVVGLMDGAYFVKAHKHCYRDRFYQNAARFQDADTVYVENGQVTENIDIALPAFGGGHTGSSEISGYVYDEETGQPIQRALVIARIVRGSKHGRRHFSRAFTDENGFYTLSVDSGNYVVSAFYWGYYPEWYEEASTPDSATVLTISAGDTITDINFTLSNMLPNMATATIYGTVTDSVTGEPIRHAMVRAIPYDTTKHGRHGRRGHWFRGHGGMFGLTDSTGAYSIDVFAPSSYILMARAPLYYREFYDNVRDRSLATPVAVDSGDEVNIDFDLVQWANYGTATVSGTVIDENSGEPIANAVVMAFVMRDSVHRRRVSVALTDSLGNYTLEYLPEGEPVILFGKAYGYYGEFYDDAHSPDSATPVIPSASGITIDLVPRDSMMGSGGINGYVFSDGSQPFSYGIVFARDINGGEIYIDVSDEFGIYSVDNLPPGDYELYAFDPTNGSKYITIDTVQVLDSYVDQDVVVSPTNVAEPVVPSVVGPELSISRISPDQFSVSFALEDNHNVSLKLYDATGRLVKNIFGGYLTSGEYSFTFSVDRSSVYFVRLAVDNGTASVKKVLSVR